MTLLSETQKTKTMGRKKRSSKVLDKARTRQAAIKSIDAEYDLGNGVTASAYEQKIKATNDSLDAYNTSLSTVDEKLNEVVSNEKVLRDYNEQVLNAVAGKYGKDSSEYEMAGGKRKSERKKPARKKANS
jgi:uncharacterized protein YukE